ncbi:MAG: porin family protein [Sulfurovum sp.]|nr:porin family protein [Sulfurovum sp.]
MKNIVLSAVAVLAMSSFAVAGGDIAPVEEPIVVVEEVMPSTGSFYLGLAYGFMNTEIDDTTYPFGGVLKETVLDEDFGSIMINLGYDFNQYVGIEGRYWFGLESSSTLGRGSIGNNINADVTIDAWGVYVKPMYPVSEAFNVYALLGYAGADLEVDANDFKFKTDSVDGFSWGIGAEYKFSNAVGIFVDYVSVYDDEEDFVLISGVDGNTDATITAFNFGVNYRF